MSAEKFHEGVRPMTRAEQERARLAADRRTEKRCKAAALARFLLENPAADVRMMSPDEESAREFLALVREEMDRLGIPKEDQPIKTSAITTTISGLRASLAEDDSGAPKGKP